MTLETPDGVDTIDTKTSIDASDAKAEARSSLVQGSLIAANELANCLPFANLDYDAKRALVNNLRFGGGGATRKERLEIFTNATADEHHVIRRDAAMHLATNPDLGLARVPLFVQLIMDRDPTTRVTARQMVRQLAKTECIGDEQLALHVYDTAADMWKRDRFEGFSVLLICPHPEIVNAAIDALDRHRNDPEYLTDS